MAHGNPGVEPDLAAGDFSSWLDGMRGAISGERASVVPCAGCTACCTGSQFVHIAPDETDALARIPAALLFPAPRMPPGHVVLGYDERGHCPMLSDGRCSIYDHRPRTCRTYDCRVFPAAGLEPDGEAKGQIAARARRWRFSYPTATDGVEHDAVQAAATFLAAHPEVLPDPSLARDATRLAVLAIEVSAAFVGHEPETGERMVVDPAPEAVRDALSARSGFRPARAR